MNSKRLPGKILKKIFKNKTLLEVVYERVNKDLNYRIVINTSKKKTDDSLIQFCKKKKYLYFRGDLKNVFKRTQQCLAKYKSDYFIRINADRPFVDTNEIKRMVKLINKKKKY